MNYTHLKKRLAPPLVVGLVAYASVKTATHYGYTFESSWAEIIAIALVTVLVASIAITALKFVWSK